jgi:hypothetical protein
MFAFAYVDVMQGQGFWTLMGVANSRSGLAHVSVRHVRSTVFSSGYRVSLELEHLRSSF